MARTQSCGSCGRELAVGDHAPGTVMRCGGCGAVLRVAAPGSAPAGGRAPAPPWSAPAARGAGSGPAPSSSAGRGGAPRAASERDEERTERFGDDQDKRVALARLAVQRQASLGVYLACAGFVSLFFTFLLTIIAPLALGVLALVNAIGALRRLARLPAVTSREERMQGVVHAGASASGSARTRGVVGLVLGGLLLLGVGVLVVLAVQAERERQARIESSYRALERLRLDLPRRMEEERRAQQEHAQREMEALLRAEQERERARLAPVEEDAEAGR